MSSNDELTVENANLITAILRYLVDEKGWLTQDDVDAILDKAEAYRKEAEKGFAEFQYLREIAQNMEDEDE